MLFNSLQFLVFFPVVTTLYFILPQRFRWILLLGASCYFYMAFVPVYILILGFTIVVDYTAGIMIENAPDRRRKKFFLLSSLVANVGVLAFFKYFNFVNGNLAALADLLHWNYPIPALQILLPIGLSFHTFQAMSYTIETYRGRQKAERHFGIYALYVMFYPQLVAGPIERPQNLLHQFCQKHVVDYARVVSGLQLMCWGFFKKVIIADRLAPIVNRVYADPQNYQGVSFVIATVLFAFQIFCDFSGYSDIAIGAAQVMGFKLMVNFRQPYFSKSISEFWKRWHISLSTWFRDYLYIPLGGSRVPRWRWQVNLMIVFLVSGIWHGASWTFLIWGFLHGVYIVASIWTEGIRAQLAHITRLDRFPRLYGLLQMAATFILVCFAWIFFRAESVQDAFYIVSHLGTGWGRLLYRHSAGMSIPLDDLVVAIAAITLMECVHLLQAEGSVRAFISARPAWVRWPIYVAAITAILIFGKIYTAPTQFIYFQF